MAMIKKIFELDAFSKPNIRWFHRYPARFSYDALSQIFKGLVSILGRLPINVLDPFAGTGTTLSLAKQVGIPSFGMELTPLGTLICEVRLHPPDDLRSVLLTAESLAGDKRKGNYKNISGELTSWIGRDNAAQLDFLLSEIDAIQGIKEQRWLQLALSSALRPSSRWLPGSIKPQIDPQRDFSNLKVHFQRVSRTLKRDCEQERDSFSSECTSQIMPGDCRVIDLETESIESVITSPPYGSMYDYFDVHRLSYLAFNWEKSCQLQIGRFTRIEKDGIGFIPPPFMKNWYYKEFKGEVTAEGRALRAYFQGMQVHLYEVWRVLDKGGVIAYAVANSTKKGKKFSLVEALAEIMKQIGFVDISIRLRKQSSKRILPAGRNITTGRFDSDAKPAVNEFIIFAKKPEC